MFAPASTVLAHVESGALKALASTRLKRARVAPSLPTLAESGLAGFDTSIWMALLAPAGTPREAIDKLVRVTNDALKSEEVVGNLNRLGMDALGGTPEELSALIASEARRTAAVAEAAGLKK